MASRKRPARLRPKTPSRVKKRKRKAKRARGHQHPELVGIDRGVLPELVNEVETAALAARRVVGILALGIDFRPR